MKVFMLATRNWLIDHVDLHATNMPMLMTWMSLWLVSLTRC